MTDIGPSNQDQQDQQDQLDQQDQQDQQDDRPSRRAMVRRLVTAAAGAAAVGTITGATAAEAGVGTMQFGAANNAGADGTSLTSSAAGARTLSVANTGSNGYAYGGEGYAVYGGAGSVYAINVTSAQIGAQIAGDTAGVAATTRIGWALSGSASAGIGVRAYGAQADLYLDGGGDEPIIRLDDHVAGEVLRDRYNDLWACVASGRPGIWRKLAGPATSGALHLIEPTRVYDSRWPAGGGRLVSGDSRGIDVSAGRNLTSGAIETAGLVPPQATALQYTITVTDTAGSGFVAVTSAAATTYRASTANWSGAGQSIANSTLARLSSPELRLWCGGGGSTHVIVDVLGYHL